MNKYWVDWTDPLFPKIRPEAETDALLTEVKSLTACKRDIKEHAREQRQHWLAIIHTTEAMTEAKILRAR